MAKFFVNSMNERAVRLSQVSSLIILPIYAGSPSGEVINGYELRVRIADLADQYVTFETGATLAEVQALAVPLLTALEVA